MKWHIITCGILALLGGLVSCQNANMEKAPAEMSTDSVEMETDRVGNDSVTEMTQPAADAEPIVYDNPVIPDPEGMEYAKKIPESLIVDPKSHEPLFLWKHRDYTPYWNDAVGGVEEPHLVPYLIGDGRKRGCVIICPGGAYSYRESKHEGSNIAEFVNSSWNMQAFVLEYRVKPADYRAMICDVLRAVRYVRYYAEDLGVDPDKITVMGFSAGGHLACMAAEMFDYGKAGDAIDHVSSRPDAAILCYPVISLLDEWGHEASAMNFLGNAYGDISLAERFSGELAVRKDMPPVFVFHSKKDTAVQYRNSEALAQEMTKQGLSCELRLYEEGGHGCGLALGWGGDVSGWTQDCLTWLREIKIK